MGKNRMYEMKLFPCDLSVYRIFIDIAVPVVLAFFGKWAVQNLLPPYKEIQVLIKQINAYYENIYGKIFWRKNGIIHIRFMNKNSYRKNPKFSRAYINMTRNFDGKTYHILPNCEVQGNRDITIDQLRGELNGLLYKQNIVEFTCTVEEFIDRGKKKGIVKEYTWTDNMGKITGRGGDSYDHCLFDGEKYCYVLSSAADAKIFIKVLPISWAENLKKGENLNSAISAAMLIVNKIPEKLPQFLKNRLYVYYPWGCTVNQAFKAIRYWERIGYKSHYESNGKFIKNPS
jgi:hypothetical protein